MAGGNLWKLISIHTLSRRVTYIDNVEKNTYQNISIHTLSRRVTSRRAFSKYGLIDFNPHPLTEGDSLRTVQICL